MVSADWSDEHQPVAEEEADGLEVHRRARHELAGLLAVEEGELERLQVAVHPVAQVELDAERHAAGHQSPRHAEQEPQDPGPRSRRRAARSAPSPAHLVHRAADEERDQHPHAHRGGGQHERDDHPAGRASGSRAVARTCARGLTLTLASEVGRASVRVRVMGARTEGACTSGHRHSRASALGLGVGVGAAGGLRRGRPRQRRHRGWYDRFVHRGHAGTTGTTGRPRPPGTTNDSTSSPAGACFSVSTRGEQVAVALHALERVLPLERQRARVLELIPRERHRDRRPLLRRAASTRRRSSCCRSFWPQSTRSCPCAASSSCATPPGRVCPSIVSATAFANGFVSS